MMAMKRNVRFLFIILTVALMIAAHTLTSSQRSATQASSAPQQLDPKAWGGNHVGKPVPEFVHGDECLFCHRNTIGATWQRNTHGVTTRQLEDAGALGHLLKAPELARVAAGIEYFMGSRQRVRFLKKDGYGRFAMLSAQAAIDSEAKVKEWIGSGKPTWDKDKFASRCVGCHATGVDPQTKTFAAFGHDCYVCHGDVNLEHGNNTALVWLSKKRRNDAKAITSLCAQCHLRSGRSRSTGLPWPNNFIAGDNLFQDFEVDLTKADDEKLNPGDRHIYRNVRDVVVEGKDYPTCINCHQVHAPSRAQSVARHKLPPRSPVCFDCHNDEASIKGAKRYTVTSSLCEY
jgi:hypothetical protein